jgi:hypothetical protein
MANHPNRAKLAAERAVLVTTSHRGVFFGYTSDTDGATIKLRGGRNCIYWPQANKGFMGLANMGPVSGARVGPAADIELRDITSVAEVTPTAAAAWEAAPWK